MRVNSVWFPVGPVVVALVVALLSLGTTTEPATGESRAVGAGPAAPTHEPLSGSSTLISRPTGSVTNRPVADDVLAAPAQDEVLFWAWDFHSEQYYQVRAVNAYRSASAWIYVEKGRNVPQAAVQSLGRVFDDSIYPTLRSTYGRDPYPGVDNQAAISVLMLDIRDPLYHGAEPHSYYSGYFDPTNQRRQTDLTRVDPFARSNEREMLYLDVAPGDPQGAVIPQTLAHEFAHLIHWSYDANEEEWLSEGISDLAVHLCDLGHPKAHVRAFLEDPTGSLVSWSGEAGDYGRAYLFMLYLHEQASDADNAWLRRLVRNPDNGVRSINTSYPLDRDMEQLYRDFVLALFLDLEPSDDARYGFASLELAHKADRGQFAFPAAVDHESGSFHEVVSLEPWELRADLIAITRGAVDIELLALGDACAGAGWRDGASTERVRLECLVSGRPVIWPFSNPSPSSRELLVIATNPSSEPSVLELASIESVSAQWHVDGLYLPVAFVR